MTTSYDGLNRNRLGKSLRVIAAVASTIMLNACIPAKSIRLETDGRSAIEKEKSPQEKKPGSNPDVTTPDRTPSETEGLETEKEKNPSTKPEEFAETPEKEDPKKEDPKKDDLASCYKGSAFICKVEELITQKTNEYRKGRGLGEVVHDPKISFVSRDWSEKQANRGYIGHTGFPRSRLAVFQTEFGVSGVMRSENVAMFSGGGSRGETDAQAEAIASQFAVMWWNSSGHRTNMLGRNHTALGVGVYGSGRGYYATQIFK